ncbi:hypothetical protein OF83DRAFT_1081972 [Amylostereum chailletii]|nr:hypothetical protein OF83DRAFT_1081972 [Amylostereum chailletii]
MSFPQYRYSTESLPHRDFELDATYESVVQHNPFLFRVFDDDSLERTRLLYRNPSSDIYEECASTDHRPQDIVASRFAKAPPPSAAMPPYTDDLFLDVFSQLMWKFLPAPTDRCFISASFSLAWAVHEADRRRNTGRQHVRIAVINACAVPHAELATYLLQEAQRHHYPHPYSIKSQWSHSSQEVLIYAHIPAKAILRIRVSAGGRGGRWRPPQANHGAPFAYKSSLRPPAAETL